MPAHILADLTILLSGVGVGGGGGGQWREARGGMDVGVVARLRGPPINLIASGSRPCETDGAVGGGGSREWYWCEDEGWGSRIPI